MNFKKIEKKWQTKWEKAKIFQVKENKKNKFYILEMFPYPSGSGLHMGHAFNYIIGDIYARFKRMNNFNVLYPTGYDSLGLPAENAAIKANTHPKKYTEKAIKSFIKQQKALGLSYDWSRIIKTHNQDYYKWDQWIFLKMFEKGLAFRKKAPVNWCPECTTVLANEQVHNEKCWRHKETNVEIKYLEQWFFRITKYANELYENIDKLKNWSEDVKAMQKNWIGKSHGINIYFKINNKAWPIFTTRPDTIFGVTFMVISAQHPQLMELVTKKQEKEVKELLKKIKSTSEKDLESLEKEGVFTGSYAINPINNEKIPIYVGNFVVADYGSGMVMAVPAHDQRDFEFAKKYNIPIKIVISPPNYELNIEKMSRAYTTPGILTNSEQFKGTNSQDAIKNISDYLEKRRLGKRTVQFKLKDWLLSRQRYWGTPIPIVYCKKCGITPVKETDLPIKLPEKVVFGKGNPLLTNKKFINTKCPKCKGKAERETDTMDTFVNSSWYFLRYCDPRNKKQIFDKKKVKYWMPIDLYIGGKEHACMHLIYFRYYTKFLRDIGLLKIDEPTLNQFNQGMIHGSDGYVMSKSRGNVVNPLTIIKKDGVDTLRVYLMSTASSEKDFCWNDKGIEGSLKFIKRLLDYFKKVKIKKPSKKVESKVNKTIKEITEDIKNLKYNLAIIKLRSLFETFEKEDVGKKELETYLKLLHPFCPHITEELWSKLKNKKFLSISDWPKFDKKKINEKFDQEEILIETTRSDIESVIKLVKFKPKRIKLFVAENWKYNLFKKLKKEIQKTRNVGELIKKVMDNKHQIEIPKIVPFILKDISRLPKIILSQKKELEILKDIKFNHYNISIEKAEKVKEDKAKKALPGKPSILVE